MLSEKTWKPEAVWWVLVGMLIGPLLARGLWTGLVGTGVFQGIDGRVLTVIGNTISLQGIALLLIGGFVWMHRTGWNSVFGFSTGRKTRCLQLALIAGVAVLPTAWLLQMFSVRLLQWLTFDAQAQQVVRDIQQAASSATGSMGFVQNCLFGLCVIVVAPVAEEMLFRGLLYPTFKQLGYPRAALWGTAALFGLLHMSPTAFLSLMFFGMVLVYLYETTDNLLAPIIAHSFFNTVNFFYMLNEGAVNRFLNHFT